jgi:hypothetical protein
MTDKSEIPPLEFKRSIESLSQRNSPYGKLNAPSNVKCYACNRMGHIARNCSWNSDVNRSRPHIKENMQIGAVTMKNQDQMNEKDDVTADSCNLDEMTVGACVIDGMAGELPLVNGILYGKNISVLRDTGCDGAVLNKRYCLQDKYTGQYINIRQIHGRPIRVPIAIVDVNTPYYSGSLKVAAIDTQICDLIIGNIDGARCIPILNTKREQIDRIDDDVNSRVRNESVKRNKPSSITSSDCGIERENTKMIEEMKTTRDKLVQIQVQHDELQIRLQEIEKNCLENISGKPNSDSSKNEGRWTTAIF